MCLRTGLGAAEGLSVEQEGDLRGADCVPELIEFFYNSISSASSGSIIFILFMRELRFIRVELIDHNHEDYWALSLQSKFHVSKASVPFTVSPQWKYFFKETNTEKNVRRTEVCAEYGG